MCRQRSVYIHIRFQPPTPLLLYCLQRGVCVLGTPLVLESVFITNKTDTVARECAKIPLGKLLGKLANRLS